ncbi:MAG: hypothetical protein ACLFRV_10150 [Acidimicrobiales bacterium]
MADDVVEAVADILSGVARRGTTITYAQLLEALAERDPDLRALAESDLATALRSVSTREDEAGRGLLTAVVVRRSSGLPGGGFFRLAAERGRAVEDRSAAWSTELARVHAAHSARG